MVRIIHRDPLFEKQLHIMQKGHKKAQLAAREAERIIQRLMQERRMPDCLHEATKSGELRIRNCLKYDLGCGYRLITLREEDCLHISFLGTHDECDRWLQNRKRSQSILWKSRSVPVEIPLSPIGPQTDPCEPAQENELETQEDFAQIDEKFLKMIFRGILEGNREYPLSENESQ